MLPKIIFSRPKSCENEYIHIKIEQFHGEDLNFKLNIIDLAIAINELKDLNYEKIEN